MFFTSFVFQKIECPVAIKFEIEEEKLAYLGYPHGEGIETGFFEASNIPGVSYRLKIYPDQDDESWLYFGVVCGNETVKADIKFAIESVGFCEKRSYVKNEPKGVKCCHTSELLYPNYMVDGKLTLKCEGILSVERKLNSADADSDGDKWKMEGFLENMWNGSGTDFTIVIDGKCLNVRCLFVNGSLKVTLTQMSYNSNFLRFIKLFSLLDLLYFRQCSNPE